MKKIDWYLLLKIILVTELIGILSGLFAGNTGHFYASFIKPPLSPPGWLFGVVWPVLYLLMGIAAYLIYQVPLSQERRQAITLYWVQMFVNFLWPIAFFRFERYGLSVAVILILVVLVAMTTLRFWKLNKTAGYLMLPYLFWLLFATYLNIGVAVLN